MSVESGDFRLVRGSGLQKQLGKTLEKPARQINLSGPTLALGSSLQAATPDIA